MTSPRPLLPAASVRPSVDQLLYVPLGGTGEIGMNLNLYGHAGAWLMVDCGMLVDRQRADGFFTPDPAFIEAHRDALVGLLLTHAHMDHIGAVPWLWPALRCPVFATPFTATVLTRQLAERLAPEVLERLDLRIVAPGTRHTLGPFAIEWLTLTHSIPEPNALHIVTRAGDVFHTGDWKLDPRPVVGAGYDGPRLTGLGRTGIGAVVGDSTNALVDGTSGSESDLYDTLLALARDAPGRVVYGCFASNVGRLVTLARVAASCARRLVLFGRSLEQMLGAARACGYFSEPVSVVPARHAAYLPREEVLGIATGSQGEPGAALARLAAGSHPHLDLEAGDRVVFSSRRIPGNEVAIDALVMRLAARGVEVVEDTDNRRVHVSGHAARAELETLYGWLRPRLVVPTHGESTHLAAHARIAREAGVALSLRPRNGDVCIIGGGPPGIVGRVATGRIRIGADGSRELHPGS